MLHSCKIWKVGNDERKVPQLSFLSVILYHLPCFTFVFLQSIYHHTVCYACVCFINMCLQQSSAEFKVSAFAC